MWCAFAFFYDCNGKKSAGPEVPGSFQESAGAACTKHDNVID
jgi:hypothetical protein